MKTFISKHIKVTAVPDWGDQIVQRKVFVPQFAEDSLEDLLEMLKSQGIIGICKMFQDPKKAESSLYIPIDFSGKDLLWQNKSWLH